MTVVGTLALILLVATVHTGIAVALTALLARPRRHRRAERDRSRS